MSTSELNHKLPYDVLREIFLLPTQSGGLEPALTVKELGSLRLVCKGWAVVIKTLLFRCIRAGHECWAQMHREVYSALMDAQDPFGGPTIRQCINVLTWSHGLEWRRERFQAMLDYKYLPNMSTLHFIGDRPPLEENEELEFSEFQFEEDADMVILASHYLHTSGMLTTLSFDGIMDIPLNMILASPTLQALTLKDASCESSYRIPTVYDLEAGYNLDKLNVSGCFVPPMSLVICLTKLRCLLLDIGDQWVDSGEQYAPQEFKMLQTLYFRGDFDRFHTLFEIKAAHNTGLVLFPQLTDLLLADYPKWDTVHRLNANANDVSALLNHAPWAGSDPAGPKLKLEKLERLHVDQRNWSFTRNSDHVCVFKNPATILRYLCVPDCKTVQSITINPPILSLADSMLEPTSGYRTYLQQLQEGLIAIGSTQKYEPQRRRAVFDLDRITVATQLHAIPGDGTLTKRHLQVLREPVDGLERSFERNFQGVELRIRFNVPSAGGPSLPMMWDILDLRLYGEEWEAEEYEKTLEDSAYLRRIR